MYFIIRSFLLGISYHDYNVKYHDNKIQDEFLKDKSFSTLSIKLGINIW